VKGIPAAAFGLALVLCACRSVPPLRPLPEGDPRPDALLARWTSSVADRVALRGNARLSVDAERGGDGAPLRLRAKQRVVFARPARLRVEVQGMLGTTLAVLAVDGGRYAWFESGSRHFESGPVHDALLLQLVGLELTPEEAVGVILGAPRLDAALQVLGAWDAGEGVTRIALGLPGGDAERSLDLDADARLRRFVVLAGADTPGWQADFGDYSLVSGAPLARRVSIETGAGTSAVLALSGVELNPTLTPDIFRLDRVAPEAQPAGEGG
jgi:outer membrane biogenesis lipoprotein LolB